MIRESIPLVAEMRSRGEKPDLVFEDFVNVNERTKKIGVRLADIVKDKEHWREEHAFQPKGVHDLIRLYFEQEVPCVVPNEMAEMGEQIDKLVKQNRLKLTEKDLRVARDRLNAIAQLVLKADEHRPPWEFHTVYYAANAMRDKLEQMLETK